MIFLTYDFVWFALAFFALYALTGRWPAVRLAIVIASGIWFQFVYGGLASLVVTLALAAISYAAGVGAPESRQWLPQLPRRPGGLPPARPVRPVPA